MKYLGKIENDNDLVTKEYVDEHLPETESTNIIEIDTTATLGSSNLVTSNGVMKRIKECETITYSTFAPEDDNIWYELEPEELCFTALGDTDIAFTLYGNLTNSPELYYSLDRTETWNEYTLGDTITLSANEKCWWKNNTNTFSEENGYITFSSTGDININGNIYSLINYDDVPDYAFKSLFFTCETLQNAPILSATELGNRCYDYMFYGCSSIVEAPELPATTIGSFCYEGMFYNCTSLTSIPNILPATTLAEGCYSYMFGNTPITTAPILPATTLAAECYNYMFYNCINLNYAPALPATILAEGCYCGMFMSCYQLQATPTLPATTLAEGCYSYMFAQCTSLTEVSNLPAMEMKEGCYNGMFMNCSNMIITPALPATTLAEACYYSMFAYCMSLRYTVETLPAMALAAHCYDSMYYYCFSLESAPTLPATALAEGCYNSMFANCMRLTAAPDLPATTLATNCYYGMFAYCQSMRSIKIGYTGNFSDDYFDSWVYYVYPQGIFYYNGTDTTTGYSAIPTGWTVTDFPDPV